VLKSAEQAWGAERWIKSYPNRLFLDRRCSRPFPFEVPDPATAKFHRIVVAHDASRRCREAFGGSGSLILEPSIVGRAHYDGGNVRPFRIGQIDPSRGFVHVFDDTSLDVVMRTLDTITDFVNYLTKKERLIESGRLAWAAGEDDRLAYYLKGLNDRGEHDFVIPEGIDYVFIDEGLWEDFRNSPQRLAQVKANETSYNWDRMIERFSHHVLAGTSYSVGNATVSDQEPLLRFMASESRFARRFLADAVLGLIEKTPTGRPMFRANRVVKPTHGGGPYYVFLLFQGKEGETEEKYRLARRNLLEMLCMATKLKFPDVEYIVGYATAPGAAAGSSEDAICLDVRVWTNELRAQAEEYRDKLGLLTNTKAFSKKFHEYPIAHGRRDGQPPHSMRNSPCSCGSGKKYKHCCMRRRGR
jgi:SEC-C motif-containing protein